jgi:hypothetical protein
LQRLDEVAYLRFASVYRGFTSLDDFAHEIELLRRSAALDLSLADAALETEALVGAGPP